MFTASQERRSQGRKSEGIALPYGEDENAASGVPGRRERAGRCL